MVMAYLLMSYSILVTSWTVVCQAPLSMRFPRQESWSGLSFPSPGDLPNPWIKSRSSVMQAVSCLKLNFFFSELFRLYTYTFQIPISLNLSNSTSCKLFLINITLSKIEEDKGRI